MYSYHMASMLQGPGMVRTREDEAHSHHLEPVGMARTARVTGLTGVMRLNSVSRQRNRCSGKALLDRMQRSGEEERQRVATM